MNTLDAAWQWYIDTKVSLKRMHRVANRHWDILPWEIRRDKGFLDHEKDDVANPAVNGTNHLDDLAIVVLFSVFEGKVRQTIIEEVDERDSKYDHRVIKLAIKKARDKIETGSFFAVIEPFKGINSDLDNLLEQVSQVRKYRNWVAHGKRTSQPDTVRPDVAYKRLQKCLASLFPAVPEPWIEVDAYYVWEDETRSYGKQGIHWSSAKVRLQEMVRTGKLKV